MSVVELGSILVHGQYRIRTRVVIERGGANGSLGRPPRPTTTAIARDDKGSRNRYSRRVLAVRRLITHRHLAMLICAATLIVKLLVPTGYMIGREHGRATIELCSGFASQPMTMEMAGTHAGMPGHGSPQDHGKAEMPCAFAGLSAASLGAVDPIQIAALIAFVMAVGLTPAVLPTVIRRGYLRPPLRGPPVSL